VLLRWAAISLVIALIAAIPGFAFGSSLLFDVDRVLFLAFLTLAVLLFLVNYLRGATPGDSP
jgi:uncharacterized membrane protein YtjA (UPF0391 family)